MTSKIHSSTQLHFPSPNFTQSSYIDLKTDGFLNSVSGHFCVCASALAPPLPRNSKDSALISLPTYLSHCIKNWSTYLYVSFITL
jgi:hypothetical protein